MTQDNPPPKTPISPLKTDLSRFTHHLDDTDLSDAQKQDMLEALWSLMVQFVDLGYGLSPTQNICGQLMEITDQIPRDSADRLHSKTTPNTFNNAAKDAVRQKGRS